MSQKKPAIDPKVLDAIAAEKDDSVRLALYLDLAINVLSRFSIALEFDDYRGFIIKCYEEISKVKRKI